ncbi:MAG: 16S rRNA (guanine(527)-N(7))-methyltransferase RsmG [Chitinophagaceae bacterium]|nr:16S rRNA (guanine(527)-N(7))-methyltransferase RsmG [Chitinophagaceae bacterium]
MEIILQYFSDFSPAQIKQLEALKQLYTGWNEKINVISRKDMDNFYIHHVLHSLAITTQFSFTENMQVMDLGSGGGFPGLPLAIFYPEAQFHLVDSINKKLTVAKEIAAAIGLNNLTVQHTRAEAIKDKKFDAIVSRAVAPLKDLWFWSKPLLKKKNTGGNDKDDLPVANGLICLKGGDLTTEIFESGCKPKIWEIEKIFNQSFFQNKYLLQVRY